MMPGAHRQDDTRACGATTIASDFGVYVNGKLWSVEGDADSHGGGALISVVGSTILIGGKKVIVASGDQASADALHLPPATYPDSHSTDVFAYG
jgi:hypothetical protein